MKQEQEQELNRNARKGILKTNSLYIELKDVFYALFSFSGRRNEEIREEVIAERRLTRIKQLI